MIKKYSRLTPPSKVEGGLPCIYFLGSLPKRACLGVLGPPACVKITMNNNESQCITMYCVKITIQYKTKTLKLTSILLDINQDKSFLARIIKKSTYAIVVPCTLHNRLQIALLPTIT